MTPICPVTRTTRHRFNHETHRCECGKWERGYTPKVEKATPRGECQICERRQCVRDGRLVNHGYQRPGHGWLVGACYGVGYRPYPATDALECYKRRLEGIEQATRDHLTNLPNHTEFTYYRRSGRGQPDEATVIKLGDVADYTPRTYHPSFADLMKQKIAEANAKLEQLAAEIKRVYARIEATALKETA